MPSSQIATSRTGQIAPRSHRVKAGSIQSRAEFESFVNQIAIATVEIRRKEAARDAQLQQIRENYAPGIAQLTDRQTLLALAAEKYASEHGPELLPGKEKSAETALARYGFRTGMPALKTLSKMTWEKVKACLIERELKEFLRQPEVEINKQALLEAAREGCVDLQGIGVKVVQAEDFFVEPLDKAEEVRA